MTPPRVVYDTMVFLQSAVRVGRAHATFQALRDGRATLCISAELIAEVRDVLSRPSITAKFPALTPQRLAQFLDEINLLATNFDPIPGAFTWPAHPDDDHLFNLAITSQADYLVTWESRILALATSTDPAAFELRRLAPKTSIVTPAQLAALVK